MALFFSKGKGMKKKKQLISNWLSKFPCKKYFGNEFSCILEYITPEVMIKFINKKMKEYQDE